MENPCLSGGVAILRWRTEAFSLFLLFILRGKLRWVTFRERRLKYVLVCLSLVSYVCLCVAFGYFFLRFVASPRLPNQTRGGNAFFKKELKMWLGDFFFFHDCLFSLALLICRTLSPFGETFANDNTFLHILYYLRFFFYKNTICGIHKLPAVWQIVGKTRIPRHSPFFLFFFPDLPNCVTPNSLPHSSPSLIHCLRFWTGPRRGGGGGGLGKFLKCPKELSWRRGVFRVHVEKKGF